MGLREYQEEAVASVFREWGAGHRSTLLVMATGTGKTTVFTEVVRRALGERGGRALVLAHRGELLDQAAARLRQAGLTVDREQASSHACGTRTDVVVGSVQTMCREKRLKEWETDAFSVVVIDEAHHAAADTYQRVIDHFTDAHVLGVTATPDRADDRALGKVFETLCYDYGIARAVREGWLVPIRARMVPLKIDLSGVAMQNGDYATGQLGHTLDAYLPRVAAAIKRYAGDRKTVVFLPLVETAKKMAAALGKVGLTAKEVDGDSPDRDAILDEFADGGFKVLCNAMLLTEGWDCPDVDCVVVLRATTSRALFAQMVGRGTRLADGKEDLLLLDFLWQTEKHDLCRPACLFTKDPDVQRAATRRNEKVGETDVLDGIEASAADAARQREDKLARDLEAARKRREKLVDPVGFIGREKDSRKILGWAVGGPATELQKKKLEELGVNGEGLSRCQADDAIEYFNDRRLCGLASPKQVAMLEGKYGFRNVDKWPATEASKMTRRIAANHWKVPRGINPAAYDPRRPSEMSRSERFKSAVYRLMS